MTIVRTTRFRISPPSPRGPPSHPHSRWSLAAAPTPDSCGQTTKITSTSSGSAGTSVRCSPVSPTGRSRRRIPPPGHGFAVADGMGGHAAGEVASRAALTALVAIALQTPDWVLGRDDEQLAMVMDRTALRFRQVDEVVRDHSQSQSGLRGMGTTLSLALSLSDALIVAHVGDSRAYLFRGNQLHRLTRDHTVGQELADRNPVASARLRHVLTRCVGGCDPELRAGRCTLPAARW